MTIIGQGAEALLTKNGGIVVKERISKSYRHKDIDTKLRKFRTRREVKVLKKLEEIGFPAPKLTTSCDKSMKIEMEFVKGKLVKDALTLKIAREIGEKIGILHANDIIHADLTTSNMILSDEVYFIDFGLSFFSLKVEDKAVDLHLLGRAMESKHHNLFPECFKEALKGYEKSYSDAKLVLNRLDVVEKRGRYKKKSKKKD